MPTASKESLKTRKIICACVSIAIVIGIMLLLFVFSGQDAAESSALSGRVTALIIKVLRLDETGLPLERAEHYVRKLAHFTIYSVLGVGLCGIAQCFLSRLRVLAASLAGILISALDEFHQLFVPGRGGTPQDVMLDYCGMVAGYFVCLGAILIVLRISGKRNSRLSGADDS